MVSFAERPDAEARFLFARIVQVFVEDADRYLKGRRARPAQRRLGVEMATGIIDTDEVLDPRGLLQRVADQVLEVVEGAGGVLVGLIDDSSVTFITGSWLLEAALRHFGPESPRAWPGSPS